MVIKKVFCIAIYWYLKTYKGLDISEIYITFSDLPDQGSGTGPGRILIIKKSGHATGRILNVKKDPDLDPPEN